MGYLHIPNLYRPEAQTILLFRECWALEKVHGTSAHVAWKDGRVGFSSGGETYERFISLFNQDALTTAFTALGYPEVVVFGEAYGGKQQGMRETYGADLRFIAFDVKVEERWLSVPDMAQVVEGLGLEVVPHQRLPIDLPVLDTERDRPSEVAERRGCGVRAREGIVLRPLVELTTNNGGRVIAKHKGEAFQETSTPRKVEDPGKLAVLADAGAVAQEWVTEMRLTHVLDKIPDLRGIEDTGRVIRAMVEDVYREGQGEVVESKEVSQAIGRRAGQMFKQRLQAVLRGQSSSGSNSSSPA